MRFAFVTLMAALLACCPFVCGATEGCGPPPLGEDACCPSHTPTPERGQPCPGDGGGCVCQGAIRAVESRPIGTGDEGLGLPDGPLCWIGPMTAPAPGLWHRAHDGHPTGLASWGDARAIRARLQNFRC